MKRCHEISWQMWRERMQLMPGLMPLLFLSGLGTIPNRSQKIFVVNDGRGEHFFPQMPQCDEFRKALEVPCPMWRLRPGSGRQAGHDWSWCHHEMILTEEGWCHVVPLNPNGWSCWSCWSCHVQTISLQKNMGTNGWSSFSLDVRLFCQVKVRNFVADGPLRCSKAARVDSGGTGGFFGLVINAGN